MDERRDLHEATPVLEPQTMPAKLAARLIKILGDVQPVPKTGWNSEQNYDYVRSSDVSLATRSVFATHGVILLWEPVTIEWRPFKTASGKDSREATIWYSATFIDGETGEQYSIRWPGIAQDLQDKVLAKCATAALKTFLVTQFQIPDDGVDNDAGEGRQQRSSGRQEQPRQQMRDKLVGTITEFERKGSGAHLVVKEKKLWAGPLMAKKFPDDAKGKGCAVLVVERENQHGKYLEVVGVLSIADKTTSAAELVPPPNTVTAPAAKPPAQQPTQQTLPGGKS